MPLTSPFERVLIMMITSRRRRIIDPTTIFDYRAPQICTIDVSNSASNDIQGDWDKIAELCALSV
jgi:hypothetical protein